MLKILKSLIVITAVAAVVGGGTYAIFSDQKKIENNTIATGTLKLTLNKSINKPFSVTNAYPGYQTDWAYMDIFNDSHKSSLPFEAYMTINKTGGDNGLWNYVKIEMKTSGWDEKCNNNDGGEKTIYKGLAKDFPAKMLISSLNYWHLANEEDGSGSPADNIRVGFTERVCQKVGIDSAADNSVQGKSVVFEEVVDAEQDND